MMNEREYQKHWRNLNVQGRANRYRTVMNMIDRLEDPTKTYYAGHEMTAGERNALRVILQRNLPEYPLKKNVLPAMAAYKTALNQNISNRRYAGRSRTVWSPNKQMYVRPKNGNPGLKKQLGNLLELTRARRERASRSTPNREQRALELTGPQLRNLLAHVRHLKYIRETYPAPTTTGKLLAYLKKTYRTLTGVS